MIANRIEIDILSFHCFNQSFTQYVFSLIIICLQQEIKSSIILKIIKLMPVVFTVYHNAQKAAQQLQYLFNDTSQNVQQKPLELGFNDVNQAEILSF